MMFLILSPFATFAGLMLVAPAIIATLGAAAVAAALVVMDLVRGRSLKLLQFGSALLFAAVGCYIFWIDQNLSGMVTRTAIDAGLLAIVLGSLMVGFPFTIQYAREQVDSVTAARPEFRRANYIITSVWVAALVTMLAADLSAIYAPALPIWSGLVAAFLARNGASCFTQRYVAQRRSQAAMMLQKETIA